MTQPVTAQAGQYPCQMYKDHGSAFPSITDRHHVKPEFLQRRLYNGATPHQELIYLCGTCHDNLHNWLYFLLGEWREPIPHPPLRARQWAQKAYDWYVNEASDQMPEMNGI